MRSTIVLVHGAFAESASWDGVIEPLMAEGHRVVTAANPLRGLAADAASVGDIVRTIEGPVVLVAHSYGGAVISNVDRDAGEIAGLVYVNVVNDSSPEAFCAGFLRPRVYVSRGAVELLTPDELRAVLQHEHHHWRMRDPLRLASARVC